MCERGGERISCYRFYHNYIIKFIQKEIDAKRGNKGGRGKNGGG